MSKVINIQEALRQREEREKIVSDNQREAVLWDAVWAIAEGNYDAKSFYADSDTALRVLAGALIKFCGPQG
jgi:hypothetical protein